MAKMKDDELYNWIINDCIIPTESETADLIEEWKKYEKIYDCSPKHEVKPKPWNGASNLFIPATRIAIDTVVATMVNSILAPDRIVDAEPYRGNSEAYLKTTGKISNFLHYATNEDIADFKMNLSHWLWCAAVYGTGIVKTTWLTKTRKVGKYVELSEFDMVFGTEKKKREPEWQEEAYYDAPYMAVVNPENFLIPLSSTSIQDAPFVVEKMFIPWHVVKQRQRDGLYQNVKLIKEEYTPGELEQNQDNYQGASQINSFTNGIFVYDYWGLVDINGDDNPVEAHIVLTKDQGQILSIEPLPFFHGRRPYDVYRMKSKPNRFYGIGLCQVGKDLQEEINTIHNMRMDNSNLAINKVYLARIGALIGRKPEDIRIFPGAVLPVTNPDDIAVLNQGDVNHSSVNEEAIVQSYFDKAMGVTDFSQGYIPNSARRAAASTVMSVMAEGNKKIEERLKYFHLPLSEVFDKLQILYYQYMDENKRYLVPGGDYYEEITPDELLLKCRFNIRGIQLSNSPDIKKQNMIQAFALLSKNELLSKNVKFISLLTRELIRALEIPLNPEEALSDDDIAQLTQQVQMQQMMSMMGGGKQGNSGGSDLVRQIEGRVTGQQGAGMGGMSSGAGINTGTFGQA
jgi:hypothetical protein